MSHYLNWTVCGYYDNEFLVLSEDQDPAELVYLDIEVLRHGVRSVGQHVTTYDSRDPTLTPFTHFGLDQWQCVSPNHFAEVTARRNYESKYPFATVHFLIMALGRFVQLRCPSSAADAALLFVDGTFSNLFKYPENCQWWIDYLGMGADWSPLRPFIRRRKELLRMIQEMVEFYKSRDEFNIAEKWNGRQFVNLRAPRARSGHWINFAASKETGAPYNLERHQGSMRVRRAERRRVEGFLRLLGQRTGWRYSSRRWRWNGLTCHRFTQGEIKKPTINAVRQLLTDTRPLTMNHFSRQLIKYTPDFDGIFE